MPAFRSGKPSWILTQSANQAFAAGAVQDLTWDTITWQDPVVFDNVSTVTVDRPGLYLVGAHITRASTATASPIQVRLRLNGVTYVLNFTSNANGAISVPVTQLLRLAAADQLVINATLHNTAASTTSFGSTEFWGARIGPERWT